MTKRILVTSALPYANGPLHLGHIAGAYLPADIFVRYCRLSGQDVVFVCGTDEHGVPIIIRAQQEGITPQQVVDEYHQQMRVSFARLGISFDNFSKTSLPLHHGIASDFFLRLMEKGYIIPKSEDQFHCETCSRFLPDRYINGDCPYCGNSQARGDQCEACGKWLEPAQLISPRCVTCGSTPRMRSTEHWFLRLGMFQPQLEQWINSKTHWRANVREFCAGWFREGLGDRAITRDLEWGVQVPLPEAKGKVLYVWFDAPIGYISATVEWAEKLGRREAWKDYWTGEDTRLVHFIGKDNIVFHAIVWPAMLMGHGDFVLPAEIPANEFLTIEGEKLSTSRNWAIWLDEYLDIFPPDPLRYCLAANAPESKDADFSWKEFQTRNNSELADILGNFVNRALTFIQKYRDNRVPELTDPDDMDRQVIEAIHRITASMTDAFESFETRRAARELMDLARIGNKYFADKQPWALRKNDPLKCDSVLAVCMKLITSLCLLMEPILPHSSRELKRMIDWPSGLEGVKWADIPHLQIPAGHLLGNPTILFAKIEDQTIQAQIDKLRQMKR